MARLGERFPGTHPRYNAANDGHCVRAIHAPGYGTQVTTGEDIPREGAPRGNVSVIFERENSVSRLRSYIHVPFHESIDKRKHGCHAHII